MSTMDFEIEQIIDVHDGDTCKVRLDLGFNIKMVVGIRIGGMDAPELMGTSKAAALVVRDTLIKWLAGARKLRFLSKGFDKYGGRWVGDIYDAAGPLPSVTKYLIGRKMAKAYAGDKKIPWTPEELVAIAAMIP